ncbi:MAG: integrase core domain-containing protein [Bacilli bacterium]|nr:integrase core domain-containing protein [Bacilli bacterium]
MEAINGWAKEELFCDFGIRDCDDAPSLIEEYVAFFNEERPAAALGYLTPRNSSGRTVTINHLLSTKR